MFQCLDHATRVGVHLNITRFGKGGSGSGTCISVSCVGKTSQIRGSRFHFHNVYVERFNFLTCVRFMFTYSRLSCRKKCSAFVDYE